jgi:hypothetical protein
MPIDAMLKHVHLPASSHRCVRDAFPSADPSGEPPRVNVPLLLPAPPPLLPATKPDGALVPVAAHAAMHPATAIALAARSGLERCGGVGVWGARRVSNIVTS